MRAERTPSCIRSYEWLDSRTLELELPGNRLRLTFLEEGLIRCHYVSGVVFERIPSYGVSPEYKATPPLLEDVELADCHELRTPLLTLRIRKADAGLVFLDRRTGATLCADAEGMGNRLQPRTGDDCVWVQKHMPEKAHFFGLGDKPCALNLRGGRYELWGADHYEFTPESDHLYKSIPFFVCLNEGTQYGIFFDNTMRSYFDFGKSRPDRLLFGADGGLMDYYFIMGHSALDTLRIYTRLTGLPPMPPLWALGYHQSKWSYYPAAEVESLAATFRRKRIPCDVIHLDIHHMEQYQSLTWDGEHFPDPAGLIRHLEDEGFKVVTIINPGIKINPDNYVWRSGFENNVFCRRHDGALLVGKVWPGDCTFPDFTSPETRSWWAGLFRRQIEVFGVRGMWTDMNEPVIFPNNTFPDDTRHDFDGYSCSHLKAHNIYGQCMARATRMGMKRFAPDRRPFVLSRAGYAGLQRWAATWTGDNSSDWENLKMANLMVQRLSTSGVSFCGADTGGFLGRPTPELFCRWMQMAAFHCFFRNHTNGEYGGQEPWRFGAEVEGIVRRAIEERYRLLPYFYTLFHHYATEGTPVIRSLAFMYPENPDTYWRSSEFFVGDALYIVPVHHPGEVGRNLFVPPGVWYSLWTDQPIPARCAEAWVPTPLAHIPAYVRGGCVLPRWPVQQYVGELKNPPCTYELWWAPEVEVCSSHYEDAGDGFGYRLGDYLLHRFTYCAGADGFTLCHRATGVLEPPQEFASFVLHALPAGASPQLVVDGRPTPGCVEEAPHGARCFRATIPTSFSRMELSFRTP